jgi:hypothetical protein
MEHQKYPVHLQYITINMSRVSIIAGTRDRVGFFNSAPDPTNADSLPPLSELNSQWGCADWMQWHKANVDKYGKDLANQKFISNFSQLSSINNAYNFCKYSCDWAQYFGNYGIDVSDVASRAVCSAVTVVDAAGYVVTSTAGAATSAAQGASSTISTLSKILPIAGVVIAVWAAYTYLYKPSQLRS